jgi:hypothetical protein
LTEAVKVSSSWRGVMRELGLIDTSAGAIRIVRRHAVRRGWSDDQLRNAVAEGKSWDEVLVSLGLSTNSGNARTFIKSHAIRLGLDFSHLGAYLPVEPNTCILIHQICRWER